MSAQTRRQRAEWAAQKREQRQRDATGLVRIEITANEAALSALLADWGLPAAEGSTGLSRALAGQLARLHEARWPELSTLTPSFEAAADYRRQSIERRVLDQCLKSAQRSDG